MLNLNSQIQSLVKAIESWKHGTCIIVSGPTGIGKTTSVISAARDMRMQIVEIDDEMKDIMEGLKQRSMLYAGKIIFIEEASIIGTKKINEIVQESPWPVVITSQDAYSMSPAIRKKASIIKFQRPRHDLIYSFLKKQAPDCNDSSLRQISRTCNGDIRAALNDVSVLKSGGNPGDREAKTDIFSALRVIFRSENLGNISDAIKSCDTDDETMIRWIEENIFLEYEPDSAAAGMGMFSKADIFSSRVYRRQAWTLKKYCRDIGIYGVALAKVRPKAGFVNYRPPRFFPVRRKNEIAMKLARKLHCSARDAESYMHILKNIIDHEMAQKIGISEDELLACD